MERRPFLDPDHPMFARTWVRWLVSVPPMAWGVAEFFIGDPFWGMLFLAAGGYAFWTLILKKK